MKIPLLLATLLFASMNLFGQGMVRISGKVTDAATGLTLPGTNILLKGTYKGALTDLSGEYSIMVPESGGVLVFSFIGYVTQEIQVADSRIIDLQLAPEAKSLDEVVVTAQAKGQISARQQQVNSSTIVNVVAPDRLQENPDANATEAIGRLPGISLIRSGGEGAALVIRGLEPKYTSVTLNGISLPSTESQTRNTNISGISQYVLQGVEVYKALTPDMEANSVGGSVNLKLKETPQGFHSTIMAQTGYNDLNNYLGNYKLQGEISNRFLKNKLGAFLSVNAERVNRSTQTMSASYGTEATDPEVGLLLNGVSLNNITTIKHKRSALLSADYRLNPSTVLKLFGLYSYSRDEHQRQSKNYNTRGAGSVGYNYHDNPYRNTNILQVSASGETNLDFLNLGLDYGLAYSVSNVNDPDSRDWNFNFIKASTSEITTVENRKLLPSVIVPLFKDVPDSLQNLHYTGSGVYNGNMEEKNRTAYLNMKIPFHMGREITGYLKFGGAWHTKTRYQDYTRGGTGTFYWAWRGTVEKYLPWVVPNGEELSALGMADNTSTEFLNGEFDFGQNLDFNRLNELTDWWIYISDLYLNDPELLSTVMGEEEGLSYRHDLIGSIMDDQDITEDYYAGYFMTQINLGKYFMFMPGVRYENTLGTMKGMKVIKPSLEPLFHQVINQTKKTVDRNDEFLLPMLHARIKPSKFLYMHLAYTQTLSRPDFNAISPNIYINTGFQPFSYIETNPELNAEFWTNYDAQITLHGNKIGLFSISGFYKTVENKIWHRSYQRLKGDPIIDPFPDASLVSVSKWENHQYPIHVAGMEYELQTSFWYLPRPFNYFTLYANYTLADSETQYPTTKVINIIPPGGGRPVPTRIDSTKSGPMLFQPKHIMNFSLGFNRKGLNIWLSYQYNAMIFTGKNYTLDAMDPLKEKFNRWDLQVTQKFSKKLKGTELIANIANLTNFMETSRLRGDPRPTYIESYGWTADFGIRYKF